MAKKGLKAVVGSAVKYIVPLAVSVGLCRLLFTDVDFDEMASIIRRECDLRPIFVGFVFAILAQVCRAFRWGIQLRALGITAPPMALVLSIFGTYAVNLVFPRLGEVWRSAYIARRQQAPFASVFGSMVADRLSDTLAVLLLTVLAFAVSHSAIATFCRENARGFEGISALLASPWLWGAVGVVVVAVALVFVFGRANRFIARVRKALVELWQGFMVLFHMPGVGRWLWLTGGIWLSYLLQTLAAFYAFPFTSELIATEGFAVVLVTFVAGSISMGVPSNGGIGPWQWAVIFALGVYGLPKPEAAAWANIVLGTTTLLTIVIGIVTFIIIALDKKKNIINVNQNNSN